MVAVKWCCSAGAAPALVSEQLSSAVGPAAGSEPPAAAVMRVEVCMGAAQPDGCCLLHKNDHKQIYTAQERVLPG